MSKQTAKSRYLCSNCRASRHLNHDGIGGPICPECNVQEMTKMRRPECGACDNTTFGVYDPEKAGVGSAEPQIECTACGWTGRIDEDGVWY